MGLADRRAATCSRRLAGALGSGAVAGLCLRPAGGRDVVTDPGQPAGQRRWLVPAGVGQGPQGTHGAPALSGPRCRAGLPVAGGHRPGRGVADATVPGRRAAPGFVGMHDAVLQRPLGRDECRQFTDFLAARFAHVERRCTSRRCACGSAAVAPCSAQGTSFRATRLSRVRFATPP